MPDTAEPRLAEQSVRDELLMDAGAGVWRFDPDADLYTFAPELMKHYQGQPLVLPRAVVEASCHQDDLEVERPLRERIVREGGSGEMELRMRAPNRKGWAHLRVLLRSGRRLPSGRFEMYGLTQDVTELAAARNEALEARAAAEAANLAKSEFLASVSHEIRTPMNGIVGVLHLLKAEPISDQGRAMLDEALACSAMLGQLINDVLDLSKTEAGKLELAYEATDPADTLQAIARLLGPQARAKGLSLTTDIADGLGWVGTDPVRLRQCLFNLIGNAVKFTRQGHVAVRLASAGKGRLRVEVEDTGIGLSGEARKRLFGRFEQADRTTTRDHGGTGLGLAITKSLVGLMGGEIGVRSEPGAGSLFWFEIAAEPCAPKGEADSAETFSLSDLEILIVDDNATNRFVGAKILESLGARVSCAEDGPAAVDAVRTGVFSLILMDINMPGMDGIEATRIIRALLGPAAVTPIIALTANVMSHQREAYRAAGLEGVVAKPFSPASLLAEIARVLAEPDSNDVAATKSQTSREPSAHSTGT